MDRLESMSDANRRRGEGEHGMSQITDHRHSLITTRYTRRGG